MHRPFSFLLPSAWLNLVLWMALTWFGQAPPPHAEEAESDRAFTSAVRLFQGGWYDRAEKELAAFEATFPNSTNRTDAILLQAQSRFQMKNYEGVIQLMESRLATAGAAKDKFLYWLAEARSQLDRFELAAKTYSDLLKEFPNSTLRLEASYGEAFARFKVGEAARTVQLLKEPTGAFQLAAKGSTNQSVLVRSGFLLAEALFAQKNFRAAEQTLTELALTPESEWQRQYLWARIEMADQRAIAALLRVTNLVALATIKSNAFLQVKSLALKAEILEQKQPEAAAQVYEDILRIEGVSSEQSRQVLLRLVDLEVALNRLTNAVKRLPLFLEQNPKDPASDLLRLTMGEIYLKQFYSVTGPGKTNGESSASVGTNLLQLARSQFDYIIQQQTNSPYVGKAYLDRAWCFWEEAQWSGDLAKLVDCQNALGTAIKRLPKGIDQATAQFKLADCAFRQKNYTNALENYRRLLEQYADQPQVKEKLFDQALHQVIRTSIDAKDLGHAQAALDRLLTEFPHSTWCDYSLLDYGQALTDANQYAKAQEALAEIEKRFPTSPLLPEVRLAIARCHARQMAWPAAIQQYDRWLSQYTNHLARPQAEFDRAWCHYQAGAEGEAFRLLTNLVQQFPSSPCVPSARLWIGDYYLNLQQPKYEEADINYQLLFKSTNSVPGDLARQARLMAAKMDFFLEAYSVARSHLTNLINDPQVSTEIGAEAWFMLGDIELADPSRDSTNKLAKFEEAINRFQRIPINYGSSRLVPLALGKIADCHFQLASQDPRRYESATNQYWQVLQSPLADAATRSQAEVGLGKVLEKMAEQRSNRTELLNEALAHYLNVVYGKNLADGEDPDPFWLSKAALAAGTLAVDGLQRLNEAERLYMDMQKTLPSLNVYWQQRLASLRQQKSR